MILLHSVAMTSRYSKCHHFRLEHLLSWNSKMLLCWLWHTSQNSVSEMSLPCSNAHQILVALYDAILRSKIQNVTLILLKSLLLYMLWLLVFLWDSQQWECVCLWFFHLLLGLFPYCVVLSALMWGLLPCLTASYFVCLSVVSWRPVLFWRKMEGKWIQGRGEWGAAGKSEGRENWPDVLYERRIYFQLKNTDSQCSLKNAQFWFYFNFIAIDFIYKGISSKILPYI